ncbi:MAG: hypothetical protein HY903_07960 [Deltaproteobacteria bacterium]|nr:hypothetical protein [Deltaproteobacteria bacterium]
MKPASRMPGVAILLAAASAFAPRAAAAREVWATADGASTLELRGFYKALGNGLKMSQGLVEGTQALAELLPEARALPAYGCTTSHVTRAWARYLLGERLDLQVGWQLAATAATDPAFTSSAALGGGVPVDGARGASRRLVDFEPVLADHRGVLVSHNLDLLAVKAHASFADVTLGRQVLSWGSGRLWNPTDLLSPFAPTDIDREARRGVDALRVSIPLASTAQLELLWLPQKEARDQGGVIRGQVNLAGFDIAPSAAKYVRDLVFGFDTSGDLGPLGVHAELAWTRALDRDELGRRDEFLRGVVGLDARPAEALVLTAEYYFNGWGARDPSGYLDVLRSDRVGRGEVFGAGRHYLGLAANHQVSELLTVQAVALTNLTDPSAMLVPALEYWAAQSVLVRFGGFLPLGRAPDSSGLRRLKPQDAALQTDVFLQAAGSLGLRSEYGASPYGLFAQIGLYLL